MVEVLLVYGSLVLFNYGIGHAAASVEAQQAIDIQPFEDRQYEILIENSEVSSHAAIGDLVADRD